VIWPTVWIVDIDPIKLRKYLDSIQTNDYDCLNNPKRHKHHDWIEEQEYLDEQRWESGQ
jgi:hypothetical protein